jgi:hypothetical protein
VAGIQRGSLTEAHMTAYSVGHYLFNHHADGLIESVKKAAAPAKYPPDHPLHDYSPYYGAIVGRAVWQAMFVYREARRLGLLESETDPIHVLVRLDVEAGEPA